MKTRIKQGFTLIELLVVITIIAILASLSMAAIGKMQEKGQVTKAIANCRQILLSIRLYSSDEGGRYPDQDPSNPATTSNVAFRNLIKNGSLEDEKIFGCGVSKYIPDGNIGSAPEYEEAVKGGENHWMMTGDLNDSASGSIPLVYENSVSLGTDPTWNADAAGRSVRGRTWNGGRIIVGTNDTSVELMKCEATKGSSVKLKSLGQEGQNLFTKFSEGENAVEFNILDIEEGEGGMGAG
jgi:prepilin-type N-terminal cleavage/methylation domain-containing protein